MLIVHSLRVSCAGAVESKMGGEGFSLGGEASILQVIQACPRLSIYCGSGEIWSTITQSIHRSSKSEGSSTATGDHSSGRKKTKTKKKNNSAKYPSGEAGGNGGNGSRASGPYTARVPA